MSISYSPTSRSAPSGSLTSALDTSTPAAVMASAISRVPIEPNSLPSSPALELMVILSSASFAARASASAFLAAAAASNSARRFSNSATFSGVARIAFPWGSKKLRPKPAFTTTWSPISHNLPTFSSRITSISFILNYHNLCDGRLNFRLGLDPPANIQPCIYKCQHHQQLAQRVEQYQGDVKQHQPLNTPPLQGHHTMHYRQPDKQ